MRKSHWDLNLPGPELRYHPVKKKIITPIFFQSFKYCKYARTLAMSHVNNMGIVSFIQKELSTNKSREKYYPRELSKKIFYPKTHVTFPT